MPVRAKDTNSSKEGLIWVCAACGNTSEDKYSFSDSTCSSHAVRCYKAKNEDGSWQAVPANTLLKGLLRG